MDHPTTPPLSHLLPWALPRPIQVGFALAAALFLGALGMGIVANQRSQEQAIQSELATLSLLSERLAYQVDAYLSRTRTLAVHLSLTENAERFLATPKPPAAQVEAFNRWLDRQVEAEYGLSAVFVMAPDGTCMASSNRPFIGRNFGFRPYFQKAAAGKANLNDWFIGSVTKTPRISAASPVFSQQRTIGVLVTEYEVEDLEKSVRSFGQTGRTAFLANHHGVVLSHSRPELSLTVLEPLAPPVVEELARTRQFLGRSFGPFPASADLARAFRATLDEGSSRTVRFTQEGQTKWSALSPLKGHFWVAGVTVPEETVLAPGGSAWRANLGLGLVFSLATFLLLLALLEGLRRRRS